MTVAKSSVTLGAQQAIPPVREPVASVLAKLGETQRSHLQRLLADPPAFMDHPNFHQPKVARTLFALELTAARSTRPWCNAAPSGTAPSSCGIISTLTAKQEQIFFLRMNYAKCRAAKILGKFTGKRLTALATRELLWWHDQVVRIQSDIVRANVPLVLAMAKRTRLGNIDYAELISEGNLALLRSVDKFDCGRGFKFSTYACRAILKSFSRVAMKIGRYRGRFPVEFDPSLERSDYLEQRRLGHEADCVSELRGIIRANAADLNEVEVKVLNVRFALDTTDGFPDDRPRTLEQVGLLIGVTKERVRQIQNRALAKLREKLQDDFLAA